MGKSKDLATGETRFVNTAGDNMTGNLGIGTTSPNGALHVKGISDHGKIVVEHGGTSGSTNHNFISFHNHAGNTVAEIQSEENATNSSALLFKTGGTTTNMTISHNGYVTTPNQPVFQAYTLSSGSNNSDLVFPSTRINIGNHYSTSTGRFTAPVAGTYLFGVTNIGGTPNDVYRYYIRRNGSAFGDTHLRIDTTESGSAYGTNAMYTWPVTCAASDYVNIYFTSGSNSSYASGDYPQFWGYLIG